MARMFESQTGQKIEFDRLSGKQTRNMLSRVNHLLKEYRSSTRIHYSEQDSGYIKLVMMEQGLRSRLSEIDTTATTGSASTTGTTGTTGTTATTGTNKSTTAMPANAKAVMDKVKRKQSLTPDEQKVMNMVALANESRRKLVREQNELHQAQVVLAAQDMIDRIQGMIEDISEMQFKDLPALVGSIKSDVGVDQAQQFQNDATQALSSLLQTMQQGKTEMETAQGVLTGQAPVVPGDTGIDGAAGNVMPDPELDTDLDVDAEVDVDVDDELSAGGEKDLGRARR